MAMFFQLLQQIVSIDNIIVLIIHCIKLVYMLVAKRLQLYGIIFKFLYSVIDCRIHLKVYLVYIYIYIYVYIYIYSIYIICNIKYIYISNMYNM